jgi:UDP:flavonoid glycosyltransferase YjiC (YdhE family)
MRVLVTANPMFGHVNTVLGIAAAAQRAGHDVALATGPDLAGHVQAQGVTAWPVGPTHAEAGGATGPFVEYFARAARMRVADLVDRAARWHPDLVVHEETELAGPVAAAVTGARPVVHGLGLMPPMRIWDALAPAVDGLGARWGVAELAATVRDATYLDVCPPLLQRRGAASGGWPDGERIWRNVRPIRPAAGRPAAGDRLPPMPATHPRTVHLTLGTVFHDGVDVLEAAITGLRMRPLNIVVTVGPGVDPARFGPQPSHVMIERYLPHALLLPRCDLVVSQGGTGIMFGALAHGLPQLVLPQGADQFINAEAGRRAGAALTLGPGEVTPDAVAAAAGRLLDDPAFATVTAVGREQIAAMPAPEQVVAGLEESGTWHRRTSSPPSSTSAARSARSSAVTPTPTVRAGHTARM